MLWTLEIKSMKNINDIQVIQDLGSLAQTSVLLHNSYVSKISKCNAYVKNQDLGIYTRYISLVIDNLKKVRIT